MSQPRILFFTSHCPGGPTYGAQLRALNLARLLGESADVEVALVPLAPIEEEALELTRELVSLKGVYPLAGRSKSLRDRLKHEVDPFYTNTHGLQIEASLRQELVESFGDYDFLWFHSVRIPNALGMRHFPKAVLDIDDIPSQFYASAAKEASGFLAKAKLFRKSLLWKRREAVLKERFSRLVVCSELDREILGGEKVSVIPNGFSLDESLPDRAVVNPPRIGFIGTLGYLPNRGGVHWFLEEVWPGLREMVPGITLRLVGSGSAEFDNSEMGVDGLGFVEDTAGEIATWSLMIVPIRVGGGTRIKIAESFARRCPVVSTRLGAFGYEVSDGEELLLADGAEEFGQACCRVVTDEELSRSLVDQGAEMFKSGLSWDAQKSRIEGVVSAMMSGKS